MWDNKALLLKRTYWFLLSPVYLVFSAKFRFHCYLLGCLNRACNATSLTLKGTKTSQMNVNV